MGVRHSRIVAPAALALLLALPSARAHADDGAAAARDFTTELALLYRVVACGPSGAEIPAEWIKVVDDHCAELAKEVAYFRSRYVRKAIPFLGKLRPPGLPARVVYPFGGGDLASALVTYPDAEEITTISLEHAGDPTRLASLTPAQLRRALSDFRAAIHGLLTLHDSTTVNLMRMQRGPLPGQVSFFLTGLAIFGHEPISLRYFRLEEDGSIHYYSDAEIVALATRPAGRTKINWVAADYSIAFSNVELRFRAGGPGGRVIVHRHIAANLDDKRFRGSALEKHLLAKGDVAAMTKAASYLLWLPNFDAIRSYLITHAVFMVSDSTGIPPRHARAAGLRQVTYGVFTGPFQRASIAHGQAFIDLWKEQPLRKVGFRYGYPDKLGNFHLLVTERQ